MDNNVVTSPQVINPTPIQPQIEPNRSNMVRNIIVVISGVLTVIVLLAIGYMLFASTFNNKPRSAQVYNPAELLRPTATPTPPNYEVNPKDTSDNAINNDTQATNQSLNTLNTDLQNIDQSFNDQQTNLQ